MALGEGVDCPGRAAAPDLPQREVPPRQCSGRARTCAGVSRSGQHSERLHVRGEAGRAVPGD